ncbi:hypothetical protein BH11PSE12_BH11PSE12_21020 [soil metagenome]
MDNALTSFLRRLFGATTHPAIPEIIPGLPLTPEAKLETKLAPTPAFETISQPVDDNPRAIMPTTDTSVLAPIQITANALASNAAPADDIIAPPVSPLMPWKPALAVDSVFFDWGMGYRGEASHTEMEQKVLQGLFTLLASDLNDAVVIPRMPTIIPQLLSSLRSKTVSTGELSRHIVKDVVLVGELINAVNSALYNPADRINHLDKAVMMLGEDGLRLLIAKVTFRPIINLSSGQYTRRLAPYIWEQSEKCAIACRYLATKDQRQDIDPFQAFLTGMMKNVGMIIAVRLLDQVCEQAKFSYSRGFQQTFSSVAATLSYRVAQRWNFPPEALQALQQQTGGSKTVAWTPLGHLLHNADLLSKQRILLNHGQLKSNDERLKIGLTPAEITCFETLNQIPLYELNELIASNGLTPSAGK